MPSGFTQGGEAQSVGGGAAQTKRVSTIQANVGKTLKEKGRRFPGQKMRGKGEKKH